MSKSFWEDLVKSRRGWKRARATPYSHVKSQETTQILCDDVHVTHAASGSDSEPEGIRSNAPCMQFTALNLSSSKGDTTQ